MVVTSHLHSRKSMSPKWSPCAYHFHIILVFTDTQFFNVKLFRIPDRPFLWYKKLNRHLWLWLLTLSYNEHYNLQICLKSSKPFGCHKSRPSRVLWPKLTVIQNHEYGTFVILHMSNQATLTSFATRYIYSFNYSLLYSNTIMNNLRTLIYQYKWV